MRNARFVIVLGATLGLSGYVLAAPCDNTTNCENPSFSAGTQAGWVASASGISGIKCLNSSGPSGNAPGSHYFFGASTTDQGATMAKGALTTSGTGSEVL